MFILKNKGPYVSLDKFLEVQQILKYFTAEKSVYD